MARGSLMPELRPVTDPDLLRQLNASEVTDPSLLTQLNEENKPATLWDKLGQTWPARMAKDVYSAAQLPGDLTLNL